MSWTIFFSLPPAVAPTQEGQCQQLSLAWQVETYHCHLQITYLYPRKPLISIKRRAITRQNHSLAASSTSASISFLPSDS